VLLYRTTNDEYWGFISNPGHDFESSWMSAILLNAANDYVEVRNCGVVRRMIRYEDLAKNL